jgi:hypothetical protein
MSAKHSLNGLAFLPDIDNATQSNQVYYDSATVTRAGAIIMDGNLTFPQDQYDLWGTDDTHVTDWALTELGFTKATS